METEEIKMEFTYACRLIAKRIVADVKFLEIDSLC